MTEAKASTAAEASKSEQKPDWRKRLPRLALAVAGMVGFAIASGFVEGTLNILCIAAVGGFTGELITNLLPSIQVRRAYFRYVWHMVFVALAMISIVSSYTAWRFYPEASPTFPDAAGTIAGFDGGGGPARSLFGGHWTMFSDNAWNLNSKAWYERVQQVGKRDGGFLRIHFELRGDAKNVPYIGLMTDFGRRYDVSRFDGVSLRLRAGQPLDGTPISVGVVVYSPNGRLASPPTMVLPEPLFPTSYVDGSNLRMDWVTVALPFDSFGAPTPISHHVSLDRKRVYQFGILILGRAGETLHGHLDVDDIHFRR